MAEDESIFASPEWEQSMGGIHENTILPYFARSPFFDPVSNNRTLETQAMNPARSHIVSTREVMEDTLRQMQGLEFMVASSARDYGNEAQIGQGRWVLRKQRRRKAAARDDDVTILATYYVIGRLVYKAPSIGSVLNNRLMTTALNLKDLINAAEALPQFSPASGHTYLTQKSRPEIPVTSQTGQSDGHGTPRQGHSREGSPKTFSQHHNDDQRSRNMSQKASSSDAQAFYESFNQFLRFRDEYMDESLLVGEPGSFTFSTSKFNVQAQQKSGQTGPTERSSSKDLQHSLSPRASMTPAPFSNSK